MQSIEYTSLQHRLLNLEKNSMSPANLLFILYQVVVPLRPQSMLGQMLISDLASSAFGSPKGSSFKTGEGGGGGHYPL